MTALRLRYQTVEFGLLDIHVRTLRDKQEFQDDDHVARDLGISSAMWPIFGVLWESGRELARMMVDYDVDGLRILEVGCGIGLASLVLNHRLADITATDRHPEAGGFLAHNAALNGGDAIPFVRTAWGDADLGELGEFDLIIGSEVLYERGGGQDLSEFLDRHGKARCEVIILDPRRSQAGKLRRGMAAVGFAWRDRSEEFAHAEVGDRGYGGRVHGFVR